MIRKETPPNTEPPSPCPKCKKKMRQRVWGREDGVHIFCSDCGWMERDPDNVKYKVRICHRCGRVPIPFVYFDMPDEKTLDDSMMKWQCCGASSPVWPNEVKFWCHMYIGMEEKDV